jgi:hypothetical protein
MGPMGHRITFLLQTLKNAKMIMAGVAVAASGALKEEFSQLTSLLAGAEDTRDIDCGVLEGAIKAIHEITKDIYNTSIF